jgi:hypothetical protein
MSRTLMISDKTHRQLKELSEDRKLNESFNYTMAGIIAQLVDKMHKKELGNANN